MFIEQVKTRTRRRLHDALFGVVAEDGECTFTHVKAVTSFLLSAVDMAGINALCRHFYRRKIRILAYHGVDSLSDPVVNGDDLQVNPLVFRAQMEELKRNFNVVSLGALVVALNDGGEIPERAVAITFDDGYRNNLTIAAPILKEYGFPATFFVTTGFLDGRAVPWWYRLREVVSKTDRPFLSLPDGAPAGLETVEGRIRVVMEWERCLKRQPAAERERRLKEFLASCGGDTGLSMYPLMTRDEVRKLAEMGFEIGPHTVTHISMSHESAAVVEAEIVESLRSIYEVTGQTPVCYSYPYGFVSAEQTAILDRMKSLGIRAAVTTAEGLVQRGDDVFRLRRLNVSGHRRASFAALVSGLTGVVRRNE